MCVFSAVEFWDLNLTPLPLYRALLSGRSLTSGRSLLSGWGQGLGSVTQINDILDISGQILHMKRKLETEVPYIYICSEV